MNIQTTIKTDKAELQRLAREEAYRQMKALGFRTAFQGVALQRDNQPGFCRPGLYVIDDWR